MGLNTIQTYIMWNFHETYQSQFDFTGDKDLSLFLQICQEEDLLVLLRLGPYSCGEWEFGGFPAWMLNHQPRVTFRTYETGYISLVEKWWAQLLPIVKPHLYSNNGSVVMVQVENEYGSYGDVSKNPNDLKYMHHLIDLVHTHLGNNSVQIYTTDGGDTGYMTRGSIKGSLVYTVGDHGPQSDTSNCQAMQEFNDKGLNPCMDSEYYTGWLTHWGDATLANTSTAVVTKWIDDLLSKKGSINMYMGYGGTSYAFWSGANGNGASYQPDITSYDYDSPISEGGEHGYGSDGIDKYLAIKNVLLKHGSVPSVEPPLLPRKIYPTIQMTASALLLDNLKALQPVGTETTTYPIVSQGITPPSMEKIGQNYGFLMYETDVPTTTTTTTTTDTDTIGFSTFPRDRAHVFIDQVVAIEKPMYRPHYNGSVPILQSGQKLQIFIENMGRLNYGTGMYDPKGIASNEYLLWNDQKMSNQNWTTYSLPCEAKQLQRLVWKDVLNTSVNAVSFTPTFYKTEMNIVDDPADTYLITKCFSKGSVWINGINIGRYWNTNTPQKRLYVPYSFFKKGNNEIVLLELDGVDGSTLEVSFADTFL
jgi:beta-galactosidase